MLNTQLYGRAAVISSETTREQSWSWVIIMYQRIALVRHFVQVSDLSAFVGRVLAYRGSDG
jgi:hypothetical protein